MRFKKISEIFLVTLLISLFCTSVIFAQGEVVDPNIPEAWYEAPQTASEMGITEFNQSSILDKKVEDGEIPEVEERLPQDPAVIVPYSEVGKYGGTATTWDTDLGGMDTAYWNRINESGGRSTPEGNVVPAMIKDWSYSDDYKEITINLREGIKWSDGEEFNAEDYMFWWEHVVNNKDLEPVPPEKWSPPLINVSREDEYTITFEYGKTNRNAHREFTHSFTPHRHPGMIPAHFAKQFHPEFIGEEEAEKLAKEYNLDSWIEVWERFVEESSQYPDYDYVCPVLRPYKAKSRSETSLILERNPYYPYVDIKGNQLPYIDKVRINLATNAEMAAMKAVTGESDLEIRHVGLSDMPLYKKHEEVENYSTRVFNTLTGAELGIWGNLTHEDPKMRAIFQDVRFRKALSLSINREEINEKVYFGEAVPRQATFYPGHEAYEERFGNAYKEYDPERARKLFDEMGLVDRNNDGYREMPEDTLETMSGEEVILEGEKFNPTFTYCDFRLLEPILEILNTNWEDVGLNIDLKMVSRELYIERNSGNQSDMSGWPRGGGVRYGDIRNWNDYAPVGAAPYQPWPQWNHWYDSGGESGKEPPEQLKTLIDKVETVLYTLDEEKRIEAQKELLETQAENLWSIGTVGMAPHPILVHDRIKNMAQQGYFSASFGYMSMYHTHQFYIEE